MMPIHDDVVMCPDTEGCGWSGDLHACVRYQPTSLDPIVYLCPYCSEEVVDTDEDSEEE